jgi:hypothetical protein
VVEHMIAFHLGVVEHMITFHIGVCG